MRSRRRRRRPPSRSSRRCRCGSRASSRSLPRAPRPDSGARPRGALEPVEGDLVGSDHAGAPAALDRHVAERHATLHRERGDGRAAVLDDVSNGAVDPDLADRGEDQVLRGDAEAGLALVADPHRARAALHEALRREHVLDLARADPEGERAERAVRRGVRVAAHDRHPRLGHAELGADHVHDALAVGTDRIDRDRELLAVALQRLHLDARELVLDRVRAQRAVGGHVVVGGGERSGRAGEPCARRSSAPRTPAGW